MKTVALQGKVEVKGTVSIVHRDRNGNIKAKWDQPMDSHIAQFWRGWAWSVLYAADYTRTGLTGSGLSRAIGQVPIQGANGVRGILVGTSNAALAYTNVQLGGRIEFGSSSNQLAADAGSQAIDFATGIATITRTFTNQNAVTEPTVRECGITLGVNDTPASCFLAVRDLLGSPVTLLFDESLVISYTIDFNKPTENWARLFANMAHARTNVNVSFIDTSNTVFSSDPIFIDGNMGVGSNSYVTNQGIVLGTGTTAVAWGDYQLETPISNGSNSGELVYYASIVDFQYQLRTDVFTNGGTDIYIKRLVRNQGTSNVDVSEIGLFTVVQTFDGNFPTMYCRAVLDPAQTLQPNESAVFTWAVRYEF
jgi:hypothetical protein